MLLNGKYDNMFKINYNQDIFDRLSNSEKKYWKLSMLIFKIFEFVLKDRSQSAEFTQDCTE